MKKVLIFILFIIVTIQSSFANRGCCSWHKGIAGCNNMGGMICRDGSLSSCRCTMVITKQPKGYKNKGA